VIKFFRMRPKRMRLARSTNPLPPCTCTSCDDCVFKCIIIGEPSMQLCECTRCGPGRCMVYIKKPRHFCWECDRGRRPCCTTGTPVTPVLDAEEEGAEEEVAAAMHP
jgi:hypothetical protein